jgi:hypothetical protein
MYEAEYMLFALDTIQWIWLTNTLEELNVPVTNTPMFAIIRLPLTLHIIPKYVINPNISMLPIIWCISMLNLDRYLSARLNLLKVWPNLY